jgi:hypothetical protein
LGGGFLGPRDVLRYWSRSTWPAIVLNNLANARVFMHAMSFQQAGGTMVMRRVLHQRRRQAKFHAIEPIGPKEILQDRLRHGANRASFDARLQNTG